MNTLASLFNLAGPDLIIIFFVILLLFGAKKLPELARGLGQAFKEFSKAKDDFEREITRAPEPSQPSHQIEPPKPAQPEGTQPQQQSRSEETAEPHQPADPHQTPRVA